MAQSMAVNDIMEFTAEGLIESHPWAAVRHYRVAAIGSPESWLSSASTEFITNIFTVIAPLLTTLWRMDCLTIRRVAPMPRVPYFTIAGLPIFGATAGDEVPTQSAILVKLTTDEPGRRNQGRMYLPGLPESRSNGGRIIAADGLLFQTACDTLKSTYTVGADSMEPVIFSRTSYDAAAVPPQPFTAYTSPISGVEVQGNLAVIRNRRQKRNVFG